jgi:ribokinase
LTSPIGSGHAVGQVIVVGSINADYALRVSRLPRPGETVTGGKLEILAGGKGANQAHAAARLGAEVMLVAAVGTDATGERARADLAADGIDTSCLIRCDGPSGVAVILVDPAGENMIAVAPGANDGLTAAVVSDLLTGRVSSGTVILASLEVPLAAVVAAAAAAAQARALLVINPAPGRLLPPELLREVILTPNEGEILRVAPPADDGTLPDEPAAVAFLLAAGARAVIVTRGGRGATIFRADEEPVDVPAPRVEVVDTVGAGDAFNGALVTALAAALPLQSAVAAATAAGAAACTGPGARQALPRRADIPSLG